MNYEWKCKTRQLLTIMRSRSEVYSVLEKTKRPLDIRIYPSPEFNNRQHCSQVRISSTNYETCSENFFEKLENCFESCSDFPILQISL